MYGKPENRLQWHLNMTRLEFVGEKRSGMGNLYYFGERVGGRLIKLLGEVSELEENKKFGFRLQCRLNLALRCRVKSLF